MVSATSMEKISIFQSCTCVQENIVCTQVSQTKCHPTPPNFKTMMQCSCRQLKNGHFDPHIVREAFCSQVGTIVRFGVCFDCVCETQHIKKTCKYMCLCYSCKSDSQKQGCGGKCCLWNCTKILVKVKFNTESEQRLLKLSKGIGWCQGIDRHQLMMLP